MEPQADLERLLRLLVEVTAFVVGACVGSFLNVVIGRLPAGESLVSPPSRCPRCLHPIRAYDNVPVLGWLWLRGRCRDCGLPISPRYPVVELLVGLLYLALARRYGHDVRLYEGAVFVSLLVAISYIDVDHWIIPHALTWPGIASGLAFAAFGGHRPVLEALSGAVIGFVAFAAVAWIAAKAFRKEALGMGDWWLLALVGAFLGPAGLLPTVMLASLQGSLVGGLLMLVGRAEPGAGAEARAEPTPGPGGGAVADAAASTVGGPGEARPEDARDLDDDWVPPRNAVPFGPFLSLGALETLFFGDALVAFWERLMVGLAS